MHLVRLHNHTLSKRKLDASTFVRNFPVAAFGGVWPADEQSSITHPHCRRQLSLKSDAPPKKRKPHWAHSASLVYRLFAPGGVDEKVNQSADATKRVCRRLPPSQLRLRQRLNRPRTRSAVTLGVQSFRRYHLNTLHMPKRSDTSRAAESLQHPILKYPKQRDSSALKQAAPSPGVIRLQALTD